MTTIMTTRKASLLISKESSININTPIKTINASSSCRVKSDEELQDIIDKIPESIRFKFGKDKEFYEKERLLFESDLFHEINIGCVMSPRPEKTGDENQSQDERNKDLEKTKARPTVRTIHFYYNIKYLDIDRSSFFI